MASGYPLVSESVVLAVSNTLMDITKARPVHKMRSKPFSFPTKLEDNAVIQLLQEVSPVYQVKQGDEFLCEIVGLYLSREDKWTEEDKMVLQVVFKELELAREKTGVQNMKKAPIFVRPTDFKNFLACRAYLRQAQRSYDKIEAMMPPKPTTKEVLMTMRAVANPNANPVDTIGDDLVDLTEAAEDSADDGLIKHLEGLNFVDGGMFIFDAVSLTDSESLAERANSIDGADVAKTASVPVEDDAPKHV